MSIISPAAQSNVMDGGAVLLEIRSLNKFEGEESVFWERYSFLVAQLCHSPLAFAIEIQDNELKNIKARFGFPHDSADFESVLVDQVAKLTVRAASNGFAFESVSLSVNGMDKPMILVSCLGSYADQLEPVLALALVLDRTKSQQFNDSIVRSQLVADIPAIYLRNKGRTGTSGLSEISQLPVVVNESTSNSMMAVVLDVLVLIQQNSKYRAAVITLVNELAARFACSQVSLGWSKGEYMVLEAVSHLDRFEHGTDTAKGLEAIFEESADQNAEIVWPAEGDNGYITVAHESYARLSRSNQLLSLPVRDRDRPVGVVVFERQQAPFSTEEMSALRLLTSQVQPWLSVLESKDQWFGQKLLRWGREKLSVWLGVEHTLAKAIAVLATILLLYVAFGTWSYRVEVSASLATDKLAYLSAPFDSYVYQVSVHAGDKVKAEDQLLVLDTEELLLKESEAQADVNRYLREAEKARAKRAMADMQIAIARSEQSKSTLERVQYYLKQAIIKAPFDGVIVEGDKDELLGAPVSKGDLIYKIVQVSDLYLKMRLNERDVDEVKVGDVGELALLTRPEETIPIKVEQIIPVAEVETAEGNIFIVKASIAHGYPDWWRPGMSGLAKIDVGERNIFWILTHRTSDFLRMYFWW